MLNSTQRRGLDGDGDDEAWHPVSHHPRSALEKCMKGILELAARAVPCDGGVTLTLATVLPASSRRRRQLRQLAFREEDEEEDNVEEEAGATKGEGEEGEGEGEGEEEGLMTIFIGQHVRFGSASPNTVITTPPSARSRTAPAGLVSHVLRSGKAAVVPTPALDDRFSPAVDGVLAARSCSLLVPLMALGKDGKRCIAVLHFSRLAPAASAASAAASAASVPPPQMFNAEDLVLAETVCALGATSLFWAQGLFLQWVRARKAVEAIETIVPHAPTAPAAPAAPTAAAPTAAAGAAGGSAIPRSSRLRVASRKPSSASTSTSKPDFAT